MSLQPDRDSSSAHNESDYGRRVFQLGEQVENLRKRAETLGMFGGTVIFNMTVDSSEELRFAGRPIVLKRVKSDRPLLSVTLNHYIKPHPQEGEPHTVFSEEFILDERSVSFIPDFIQFQPDDLNRGADKRPPVIWKNIRGDWRIYRGRQRYAEPYLPTRTEAGYELLANQVQVSYLTKLMESFTPGCEDGRYER